MDEFSRELKTILRAHTYIVVLPTFYPAYPAYPTLEVKNLTCEIGGMSGLFFV